MEGIHHVLEVLQPVARHDRGAAAADARVVGIDELSVVEDLQRVIARQDGLPLGRAHVGEEQTVALLHRIPRLAHEVAVAPAVRFARLLQAVSLDVEQPAVIAAAEPALLDLAVVERGPAVRAACVDEPGAARPVAEEDQVLAEDPYRPGRGPGVSDQTDRVPVAAQQLAHRRARPDLGELAQVGGRRPPVSRARVHGSRP